MAKFNDLSKQIWQDTSFLLGKYFDIFTVLKKEYQSNKKKVILTSIFLISLFALSFLVAQLVFPVNTIPPRDAQPIVEVSNGTGQENAVVNSVVLSNLVLAETILTVFAPLLDGFVATTPDVAGKINDTITFSYGSMSPASQYSNMLLQVLFPFMILLLAWQGLLMIYYIRDGQAKDDVYSLVGRLVTVIVMLIFTPYILSYSIAFINALNTYILGNDTISGYIKSFFAVVRENYSVGGGIGGAVGIVSGLIDSTVNPVSNIQNTFQIVLVITPIYVALAILLFIIFQFVVRFLKLYFLAIAFPFVVIFYLNKDSQIPKNFWKEWTTALIHQVGFIMGYRVLNDMARSILTTGGVGIEQVLIYIGGLMFLLSINLLTAQIWGNAFSAISDTIAASNLGSVFSRPFAMAGGAVAGFGAGALGVPTRNSLSGFLGSKTRDKMTSRFGGENGFVNKKSNGKTNSGQAKGMGAKSSSSSKSIPSSNSTLKDPTQSKAAQRMSSNGYSVSSVNPNEGVVGVSGQWYGYDHPSSGVTTLYESKDDALADQVRNPHQIYPVKGSYNMLDTVNYQGMRNYAERIGSKVLPDNTPNSQARSTLNNFKENNLGRGVDGITTSQYPRQVMEAYQGKPPKDTPRIQKSYVYKEKIEENN